MKEYLGFTNEEIDKLVEKEKVSNAVREVFPRELGELMKQIALGKYRGTKELKDVLWRINRKIHVAGILGATQAKGFSSEEEMLPILLELANLVEFTSSPEIRLRIFRRLLTALATVGVEEKFLGEVN